MKKYLRAKQVAEKTGLAYGTVRQLTHKNEIPYYKFSSNVPLYEDSEIDTWISERSKANSAL